MVDEKDEQDPSAPKKPETLEDLLAKGKRLAQANSQQRLVCYDCGKSIALGRICDVCGAARKEAKRLAEALATVPEHYLWATFSSPDLGSRVHNPRAVLQARSLRDFGRIVFIGPTGSGKTSLSVATLRDRLENTSGARCCFVSAWRLGGAMAQLDESDPGAVVRALNCQLLVLDDVGSERPLPSNPVPDIIVERHQSNKATWITTWMSASKLEERYGGGIARRVFEHTAVVDCG